MKKILIGFLVMVFTFCFSFLTANATNAQGNQNRLQQAQAQNQVDDDEDDDENDLDEDEELDDDELDDDDKNNRNKNKNKQTGKANAAEHRSAVANFVQGLLSVADREPGGIGEQVREVARAQSSSTDKVVQAMEQVQTRSKIKTFLFGSDYKNLGALRSEMVQTRNRLEQLNRLLVDVVDETDKTELQEQIDALTDEQTKIDNFIQEREQAGKISLLGWLVRLFN